ncbi:MAG: hypothetical protein JNK37_07175 [Verrucomicrobiales bacterium]|nr:hypothetical protein [Verrucomicrobiales bacterium]
MKPLLWDAINPFTGLPFTWDDPNLRFVDGIGMYLEPGDPGFVPYDTPPPPRRKPFRRKRKLKPNPEPNPTQTMSSFKYNVAPNPNGGFTTRPVLGPVISSEAFLAKVATDSGLTPEQAAAAFDAIVGAITACATGCDHATDIRGLLRFRPTSGGTSPTPDGFHNPDDINADIAISLTAAARDAWRAGLTLESLGEVGKVSPLIDSILSQENGAENHYVPGTLIVLNGDLLRFQKTDPTQGVFFRSGNNAEVRATIYGTITPTSLSVLVPDTLTGPLSVRVAAYINGSVRSFTYMTPITN